MPLASTENLVLPIPAGAPSWFQAYHNQLMKILYRNQQRIDQGQGLRARPAFSAAPTAYGNRIEDVGDPSLGTDALNEQSVNAVVAPGFALFLSQAHTWPSAQTWNALGTFDAGITFGDETLSAYDEANFTATGNGFTAGVTGTANIVHIGKLVLLFVPALSGTSNATTFTVTGLPAGVQPTRTSHHVVRIADNAVDAFGVLRLNNGSTTIDVFASAALAAFTAGGTKTLYATALAYLLL